MQLLEGPEAAVEALYARIRGDARHTGVATVGRGPGPHRFSAWSMDAGHVTAGQLDEALRAGPGGPTARITDPRLRALLQAFS